jgi:hypothetical protein
MKSVRFGLLLLIAFCTKNGLAYYSDYSDEVKEDSK